MEQRDNGNAFSYTYSVNDRTEVEKIREKYVKEEAKEENKLERLRKLDMGVTKKAQVSALTVGIIGTLFLGMGMSLIMTELSEMLGYEMSLITGIIIGVIGGAMMCAAYPLYSRIIERERKKIAPEIIKLTDELMK